MKKYNLYCEEDKLILAVRAAKYKSGTESDRASIIAFEDGTVFLVKKTKTGAVTVMQEGYK